MVKLKLLTSLAIALLSLGLSAPAALYNSGFANGTTILDGNVNGWSDTRTVAGLGTAISSVSVTLNLSGGYNGDLYAYLSYNGSRVVLLNRVGVGSGDSFGYDSSGMSITLADNGAGGNIHVYGGGTMSGTFAADGRNISPLASAGSFDAAGTQTFSTSFGPGHAGGAMNPNGDWTLFIADVSGGGGTSSFVSWSLDITTTAVPEPVNLALGIFAGIGVIVGVCRSRFWTKQSGKK